MRVKILQLFVFGMEVEPNGLWASVVLSVLLDRSAATPYRGLSLRLGVQSSGKKDRT